MVPTWFQPAAWNNRDRDSAAGRRAGQRGNYGTVVARGKIIVQGRCVKGRPALQIQPVCFASFPNSVWERTPGKLRFPSGAIKREPEFRDRAFPNGVWEREWRDYSIRSPSSSR